MLLTADSKALQHTQLRRSHARSHLRTSSQVCSRCCHNHRSLSCFGVPLLFTPGAISSCTLMDDVKRSQGSMRLRNMLSHATKTFQTLLLLCLLKRALSPRGRLAATAAASPGSAHLAQAQGWLTSGTRSTCVLLLFGFRSLTGICRPGARWCTLLVLHTQRAPCKRVRSAVRTSVVIRARTVPSERVKGWRT